MSTCYRFSDPVISTLSNSKANPPEIVPEKRNLEASQSILQRPLKSTKHFQSGIETDSQKQAKPQKIPPSFRIKNQTPQTIKADSRPLRVNPARLMPAPPRQTHSFSPNPSFQSSFLPNQRPSRDNPPFLSNQSIPDPSPSQTPSILLSSSAQPNLNLSNDFKPPSQSQTLPLIAAANDTQMRAPLKSNINNSSNRSYDRGSFQELLPPEPEIAIPTLSQKTTQAGIQATSEYSLRRQFDSSDDSSESSLEDLRQMMTDQVENPRENLVRPPLDERREESERRSEPEQRQLPQVRHQPESRLLNQRMESHDRQRNQEIENENKIESIISVSEEIAQFLGEIGIEDDEVLIFLFEELQKIIRLSKQVSELDRMSRILGFSTSNMFVGRLEQAHRDLVHQIGLAVQRRFRNEMNQHIRILIVTLPRQRYLAQKYRQFLGFSKSEIETKFPIEFAYSSGQCAICLEEYVIGAKIISFGCKHQFHKDCVVDWLLTSKKCPTCRQQLVR